MGEVEVNVDPQSVFGMNHGSLPLLMRTYTYPSSRR